MSNTLPEVPMQWIKGLVPTLNDKGFMFEVLDGFADEFIRMSGSPDDEVLDIGCAYGVATISALKMGARVTACDMDQRHLEILKSRTPEDTHSRLTVLLGTLTAIDLRDK